MVLATDLLELVDDDTRAAVVAAADALAADLGMRLTEVNLGGADLLRRWREAFRQLQLVDVWHTHGEWVTARRPKFGPGVSERFAAAAAASADPAAGERAAPVRAEVRRALGAVMGDGGVLVQPAAASPAPPPDMGAEAKVDLRNRILTLTCPASMAGAPVVTVPRAYVGGLPVGVALVGLPGDDDALVALAEQVS
jgi:amidase